MKKRVIERILQCIRNHPDPERARYVLEDVMRRISAGEDPEALKATYAADLAAMLGGETE